MSGYELYALILSLVVLVTLSALFIIFLRLLICSYLKLLRNGLEDQALLAEETQAQRKPNRVSVLMDRLNRGVSIALCVVLVAAFLFSLYVQISPDKHPFGLPSLTVVKSASMSYRDEGTTYLFQNNIEDQFDTFDIILLEQLPDEYDLKLYDIVVYEAKDGTPIVHRIVEIEEPNEAHPDCRHFKLQGDAVTTHDRYPVLYSQMRGIYSGNRIRFVGSFVLFMQSPAGWICILLVLFAMIATPIIEKKLQKEKALRLELLKAKATDQAGLAQSMRIWKRLFSETKRFWSSFHRS